MKNKGFTMIELVVAVAIMGIIMIIAIPSVNYIQQQNKNKKYEAYKKSLTSSSKLYVDGFSEDLFGSINHGCAIIKFEDLQDKDLIEDIQIKDTTCSNKKIKNTDKDDLTYVMVRKSKIGNYNYSTNITCRNNSGSVLYIDKSEDFNNCQFEDGQGPEYTININPKKGQYYLGDNPKTSITIRDKGVGLKEKQTVSYYWQKKVNGTFQNISGESGTINFNNKNYEGSKTKPIKTPTGMENIDEPTEYQLVVTGSIEDIDNHVTQLKNPDNQLVVKYFVGALLIQMKAGGGVMINPHNTNYQIDSSDYIYHGTGADKRVISKIKYKGKADLWNYNNPDWINIGKTNYYIEPTEAWKGTKLYDQDKEYSVSDFGYKDSDLIYNNQTATVTANWKQQIKITVVATNQSKVYDGNALNADTTCSVASGSLLSGDKISCTSTGSQSTVGSSTKTLSTVTIKDSKGKDVTYKYLITKNNGTLTITCGNNISGTLAANKTVTYGGRSWTVLSVDSSSVTLAYNDVLGHGSFNDAVDKVTKKLKNETDALKNAINSKCATVLGSDSNNKGLDSGPYWLKSGKVYFPKEIHNYKTDKKTFAHGYTGVITTQDASSIKESFVSSCETNDVLYKADTTHDFANNKESIAINNGTCDGVDTTDVYSRRISKYHPYAGGGSDRLRIEEYSKELGDSEWSKANTIIINCYKFRWQLCGGTYSGKNFYIKAKDSDEFYAQTTPGVDGYTAKKYKKDGSNNKYIYLAGWKPGGSDNCKTLPSPNGYCGQVIPNDTSENHGGYSGKDAHHYYDFYHNGETSTTLCVKRSKKTISDREITIKYRPTIKVIR